MRESFVFYKSFYEAIEKLPQKYGYELYRVICQYSLNGEVPEMSGIAEAMFTLMKANIDATEKKYISAIENGKKGGRPKKEAEEQEPKTEIKSKDNPSETESQPKDNLNDNVNVNVNDTIHDTADENVDLITAESSDEFPPETKETVKTEQKKEIKNEQTPETLSEAQSETNPEEKSEKQTVTRPDPKPENVVEYLPLLDGTEYPVSKTESAVWNIAYPALNVPEELHRMRAWLEANPKNRKSLQGIKRFIVNQKTNSRNVFAIIVFNISF